MRKAIEQKAEEWQLAMQHNVEEKEQEILSLRRMNEAKDAKLREMTRFAEVREHTGVGIRNIRCPFYC